MSTFYVLPPRPLPARPYADFLRSVLPGLELPRVTWGDLADTLSGLLSEQEVYLLHREDLAQHDRRDPDIDVAQEVVYDALVAGGTPALRLLGTALGLAVETLGQPK